MFVRFRGIEMKGDGSCWQLCFLYVHVCERKRAKRSARLKTVQYCGDQAVLFRLILQQILMPPTVHRYISSDG